MPIYEYRCPNGHTFEVFQKMTDPPADRCESCGASPVEKVLFPVAVHFKGSGFYSTDYGRGSRKAGKEGDSGAGDKKDTGEKTAAKAEPSKADSSKKSDGKASGD